MNVSVSCFILRKLRVTRVRVLYSDLTNRHCRGRVKPLVRINSFGYDLIYLKSTHSKIHIEILHSVDQPGKKNYPDEAHHGSYERKQTGLFFLK